MLSTDALEALIGLKEKTALSERAMAERVSVAFFPIQKNETVSKAVRDFAQLLESNLKRAGVTIVPYEKALEKVPLKKRGKRLLASIINNVLFLIRYPFKKEQDSIYLTAKTIKGILKPERIKPGISIVTLGENEVGNMPIDVTSSFRLSSVLSIVDKPKEITEETNFHEHFDTAMSLFAHHMANIVILVSDKDWIIYNFNASHPLYPLQEDISNFLLRGLIPKIAAPILPLRLKDFVIKKTHFDPNDLLHLPLVEDLIESGQIFEKTGLYPKGKKIKDLPFRNSFYAWIGGIHLDHRTGMSYGFLANQLPTKLETLIPEGKFKGVVPEDKDFFMYQNALHIKLELHTGIYLLKVPEVSVISQRSGSDKTNLNKDTDLVKLGLINGTFTLETPTGLSLTKDYRPSFDTGVILAHAVGNAIIASILKYFKPEHTFVEQVEKKGMALSHWHGYINRELLPSGWYMHGLENPHVSCSSPQSAVYAIQGKLSTFAEVLKEGGEYNGDIHIEPHHGTNITYPTLKSLATLFTEKKNLVSLGNKYLLK